MRKRLLLMMAATLAALCGTTHAASNPSGTDFTATCSEAACASLPASFDGKIEWYSGAVLLFTEIGTLKYNAAGQVGMTLTGNGSQAVFRATYGDPMMTVFTAPDLNYKVYSTSGGNTLLASSSSRPMTTALWSKYSEDAQAEIIRATAAEDTLNAALNLEISKRSSGDRTFQLQLDAEVNARTAADNTLTTNLNAEITRAKAAEQVLTTNLNAEVARATTAELVERDRAMAAEAAEFARATAAEAAETARATAAETLITENLNIERDRAIAEELDIRDDLALYSDESNAATLAAAKTYADERYSDKACPDGSTMFGIDADGNPRCTSTLSGRVKVRRVSGEGTCTYSASGDRGFDACSCTCSVGGWWGSSSCSCSCSSTTTVTGTASSCTAPAVSVSCPNVGGVQGPSELVWCQKGTFDDANGCLGASNVTAMGTEVTCSAQQIGTCSCGCTPSGWWGNGWWGNGNTCSCSCQPSGNVTCQSAEESATVSTAVAFCAQVE